jgi:uncharacterized protein (TIGR02594 family)
MDTAFFYVGVHEKTGHNDGVEVERFLKSVGRKKGDSWCAAFVSYCLTSANHSFPVRSGLARNFVTKKSILATDVLQKRKSIEVGDLIIWQKGNSINGHIGFVYIVESKLFFTIEGNTSSGLKGSQADGDGVYIKKRTIQPFNYFRVKWFTKLGEN